MGLMKRRIVLLSIIYWPLVNIQCIRTTGRCGVPVWQMVIMSGRSGSRDPSPDFCLGPRETGSDYVVGLSAALALQTTQSAHTSLAQALHQMP